MILLALLILSAVPGFFSGADAWYVSHSCLILREAIAAAIIYYLSGKYHISIRVSSLLWLTLCLWDLLLLPAWLWVPQWHSAINWCIWPFAILAAIYYSLKHYDTPLESGKVYAAVGRPRTVQGFILAMFGVPGGSIKLIADGHIYGYRNGTLQGRMLYDHTKYVIIPISNTVPRQLSTAVGTKWTWRSNCLTLTLKVLLWTR